MTPKKAKQMCVNTENTGVTENEPVSLNSLNFDCLQNILKYLPIKHRIAVERVSKTWNLASKSSWGNLKSLCSKKDLTGLKKELYMRSFEDRVKILESVLSRCGKFVTTLNLPDYFMFKELYSNPNRKVLNAVMTNCTNLKSLYIKDGMTIDKSSIPILKMIVTNLKNFECEFNNDVTDEDLELLFSSCKDLENLCVAAGNSITGDFLCFLKHDTIKTLGLYSFPSANPMHYAVENFKNLERLLIGTSPEDFNVSGSNLMGCTKSVKSLCLEMNYGIHDVFFISKMKSVTRLELLEADLTNSMLFQIANFCSKLQYLELSAFTSNSDATDEGVQALSGLSKLEVLRLRDMHDITGDCLKHFSTLKKFEVAGLEELSEESLCNILHNCKELEELKTDYENEECNYNKTPFNFFLSAKKFLKQRFFVNKKPMKIVFRRGFVIVTADVLTNSEKVKLFFEVYKEISSEKSLKVFGTNDFLQFIQRLHRDGFDVKSS